MASSSQLKTKTSIGMTRASAAKPRMTFVCVKGALVARNAATVLTPTATATPVSTGGLLNATEADIARFMDKVDILPNGCWFWTGARSRGKGNSKWYGSFRLNGTSVRAHRFSSEVFNQDVCPPGHHRDHTCHFSLCVAPHHIEVVTKEENQARKRR